MWLWPHIKFLLRLVHRFIIESTHSDAKIHKSKGINVKKEQKKLKAPVPSFLPSNIHCPAGTQSIFNTAWFFTEELILDLFTNITSTSLSDHMQYRSGAYLPNISVPHIATQGLFVLKYAITVLISTYKYITSHSIILSLP